MNTHQAQSSATESITAVEVSTARRRAARLVDGTIFTALLALIALVAIPYGTVEPWWETVFECAVFGLGALWIAESSLRGTWRVREPGLLAPLLFLAAFAFLQTVPVSGPGTGAAAGGIATNLWQTISADPFETRRFVLKLLALILCGELLLCYTSSPRRLRALIYTVIGVGVASALFGVIRQTAQRGGADFILSYLPAGTGYGQLINRNHFALLMELALGLILGLIAGGGVRREHLLTYAAAALPVWAALVLTTSRGGILSMLVQILFLALMVSGGRSAAQAGGFGADSRRNGAGGASWLWRIFGSFMMRMALAACLVGAVAFGIVWMGGDQLTTRLETLSGEVNATSLAPRDGGRRIEIWRATWEMFKAHPLTGVGFGAYRIAITEHHDASGRLTPEEAHNDYLEVLASGGLPGAALALWFVLAFIRRARSIGLRAADPFRRAACLGALVSLAGVAVHSLVDFGLHITINSLLLTALIVIAVADNRVGVKLPGASGRWS